MLESWRIGNDILVNCMIKNRHLKEDERVLFLEREISKIHFKGSFFGGEVELANGKEVLGHNDK